MKQLAKGSTTGFILALLFLGTRAVAAQDHEHHQAATAGSVRVCDSVGNPARGGCSVEEFLLSVLDRRGVEAAMASLDSLAAGNGDIRRDAHSYAHAIGLAAFSGPETVGEVFGRCTPDYQSGCYHGVIQSYFLDHASTHGDHMDGAMVNALCREQRRGEGGQWLLFQCAHGMGHGLLMVAGHHLPTALGWCDLVDDPWERESCYGGVFMENIVAATVPHHGPGRAQELGNETDASAAHDHHGAALSVPVARDEFPPLRREDPFYPCTAVADRYLAACYQMQTSAILYFNGLNLDATARLCGTVADIFQPTCFQSLGRDISSITQQDHQRAIRLCGIAPDAHEPWCHIGYTKNLIDVTADAADGFAYCKLLPSGDSKRFCYIAVGEQIWVLSDSVEEREEMCTAAEASYLGDCRRGAGLGVDPAETATALHRGLKFSGSARGQETPGGTVGGQW